FIFFLYFLFFFFFFFFLFCFFVFFFFFFSSRRRHTRFDCDWSSDVCSSDLIRGNRAEVSITIKEGSSQLIGPLVTVKLYYLGELTQQMTTPKCRVVFILNRLGPHIRLSAKRAHRDNTE